MPGGDGTGPDGSGPKTGRKLGNCTGNTTYTDSRRPFRLFRPFRRNGRGRGRRNMN